jgi:hypothetical protein
VSKCLFARFEDGCDVVGLLFTQQLDEHVGEDVDGLRDKSLRRREGLRAVLHRRVKRTEDVRHRVD